MLNKIVKGCHLKRLDNIIQWQEKDVFKKESVSQHSYKVTIFCRTLLEDIFGSSKNLGKTVLLFKIDCVDKAMFHDWDESLIRRDISHETKYNNYNGEKIRSLLDDLTNKLAIEDFVEFEEGCDNLTDWKPASILFYENIVKNSENVLVSRFVKLCDWLALSFYIEREISLGNNGLYEQKKLCGKNICKTTIILKKELEEQFQASELNFYELNKLIEDYGRKND